ncbi:MAG: Gfo/Idh/MocA family oxidoreductase [Kiritimatiellae bacterium]|nr:Gfo/Idh/MocA family oxidoreductase [Kiritimatiellia bacterium]
MRAAIEHRKHLFVEKPMCYTEEDLRIMVPLMRKAFVKFMVGFNRPYSPLMQALKPIYRRHKEGRTTDASPEVPEE